MHGGRGEPVRLTLAIAGVDFDDERISFPEFGQRRDGYPFCAVPTLEIEGQSWTQSNAMLRYFGAQCGLYPSDPMQALRCDEAMGVLEDASHALVRTFGLEGDAMKAARTSLVEKTIAPYLRTFNQRIAATEGLFLSGDKMTVADLKLFVWARALASGRMDHIPTNIVEAEAPRVAALRDAVAAHEGVQAYYAQFE